MARGATSGRALSRDDIPVAAVPRFWAKVDRSGDGCWLWTGAHTPYGTGIFSWHIGGRRQATHLAHRVAYVLQRGDIPAGMVISSTCPHSDCMRGDCLQCLTHAENLRGNPSHRGHLGLDRGKVASIRAQLKAGATDRELAAAYGVSLGRVKAIRLNKTWHDEGFEAFYRGQASGTHFSKLTSDDVAEARAAHAAGERVTALAEKYGVVMSTMWDAVHGKTWRHLPMLQSVEQA